ncbi:MAG: ribonuclease P protein component [Desulfobacteraceae bacterium]
MERENRVSSSRNTFTKGDRLLHRSDFVRLSKDGKRFQNRYFIAYCCKNNFGRSRLGITVTRRVGKAAKRNRIKRLAREYFRQNRHIFQEYWDINIIAKKESVELPNKSTLSSLENIFARIATYQPN